MPRTSLKIYYECLDILTNRMCSWIDVINICHILIIDKLAFHDLDDEDWQMITIGRVQAEETRAHSEFHEYLIILVMHLITNTHIYNHDYTNVR